MAKKAPWTAEQIGFDQVQVGRRVFVDFVDGTRKSYKVQQVFVSRQEFIGRTLKGRAERVHRVQVRKIVQAP